MFYRLAADALVFLHALFVLFVVLGGLLAIRWRRAIWIHVPAALWGIGIEVTGQICPLTPLENRLRVVGEGSPYPGDFIERYLLPVLYPAALSRRVQITLGLLALASNLLIYGWFLTRIRARKGGGARPGVDGRGTGV